MKNHTLLESVWIYKDYQESLTGGYNNIELLGWRYLIAQIKNI